MFELASTTFLVAMAVCFGGSLVVEIVLGRDAGLAYARKMTVVFFEVIAAMGCIALGRYYITKFIWVGDTATLLAAVAFVSSMSCIVAFLHWWGILSVFAPQPAPEPDERNDTAGR